MTFSYSVSDLTSTTPLTAARAAVRFRIGDNDSAGHVLENEEIDLELADAIVTTSPATYDLPLAALKCARRGLAKLQKSVDSNGAGISASRTQRFFQMKDLIVELEKETMGGLDMTLTGSQADKDAIAADTSRTPPVFSIGWDRYT